MSLILFITLKRLYEPWRVKVTLCSTSFCTSCPFFLYWVTDKSMICYGLVSSTLDAVIVSSAHALFIMIIPSWHYIKEHVAPVSSIKMFGSLSRFLLSDKLIFPPKISSVFTLVSMNSTLLSSLFYATDIPFPLNCSSWVSFTHFIRLSSSRPCGAPALCSTMEIGK